MDKNIRPGLAVAVIVMIAGALGIGVWLLAADPKENLPAGNQVSIQPQTQPEMQTKETAQENAETPVQESVNVNTEDWKTYRNEKYGVEFKYPENWEAPIEDDGEIMMDAGTIYILWTNELDTYPEYKLSHKEFITQINKIKRLQEQPSNNLRNELGYPNKYIDCNVHGGYIDARTIYSHKLNINLVRTIGWCGTDVDLTAYYYFIPIITKAKIVMLELEIFPAESYIYRWANKNNNDRTLESNINELLKSGTIDQLPDEIENRIIMYDKIAQSVAIN